MSIHRSALRIGLEHFSRVIEHDMVNFVADDEQDFPQAELAQKQRVSVEHRRKTPQQDARNAAAGEIHLIGQVHQKIAIIAVSPGDQKQLHQLQHLHAVASHLGKELRCSVAVLNSGDIHFDAIQKLRNVAIHAASPCVTFSCQRCRGQ